MTDTATALPLLTSADLAALRDALEACCRSLERLVEECFSISYQGTIMTELELDHWREWFGRGQLRKILPPGFPRIVTLCGSTKFKQEFIQANFRESMAGNIVLSVGLYSHADCTVYSPTDAEKVALDELHFRKVEICDEVFALNVRGYVGFSTRREVLYAHSLGKPVRWLEPENVPDDLRHVS